MLKNFILIFVIAVGGFMVSVTSNNLGELGNKIMLLVGRLILLSVIIFYLYEIIFVDRKNTKDKTKKEK